MGGDRGPSGLTAFLSVGRVLVYFVLVVEQGAGVPESSQEQVERAEKVIACRHDGRLQLRRERVVPPRNYCSEK